MIRLVEWIKTKHCYFSKERPTDSYCYVYPIKFTVLKIFSSTDHLKRYSHICNTTYFYQCSWFSTRVVFIYLLPHYWWDFWTSEQSWILSVGLLPQWQCPLKIIKLKNINDGKNLKINVKSIATVCQTILINWTSNFFFCAI